MLKPDFGFGGYLPDIFTPYAPSFEAPHWDDERSMTEAVRESMLAAGTSSPNPAVGCVVIKDGRILARGHTQPPGGAHAERQALLELRRSGHEDWPSGSTVYVTLEPCSHFGRTPPCADLFATARDVRVVVGCTDPNPLVSGQGLAKLRSYGLAVTSGVLEDEVGFTLLPFFHSMGERAGALPSGTTALQRPFVGLKWAQSIDGKMADDLACSQWLTGSRTQFYTHWLRQKYDALAVGFETLRRDKPRLTARALAPQCTPAHPLRVCFDPRGHFGRLSASDQKSLLEGSLTEDNPSPWVIFSGEVSQEISQAQVVPDARVQDVPDRNQGAVEIVRSTLWAHIVEMSPTAGLSEFLKACLQTLAHSDLQTITGRSVQSLMVEGGPRILDQFLELGEFEVCHGLMAPFMLGASRYGVGHTRQVQLKDVHRLRLMQVLGSGDDVICEWKRP